MPASISASAGVSIWRACGWTDAIAGTAGVESPAIMASAAAPEVFSFAEDGSLLIQTFDVPPNLEDKVRDACMMCPTQSIQVEEE